jgi:hypothetical protein
VAGALAAAAALAASGCQRRPAAPPPALPAPAPAPPAARLPEDPVAGRLSELQWRQHMLAEEHERQLAFDHNRVEQHRGVVELLAAARTRYDRARTQAAVARVQGGMPAVRAELRKRTTAIDHWGVTSPLLADYDAWMAALEGAYPTARIAALGGDADRLGDVRADLDRRAKKIDDWLEEAAASEDE